MDTVYFGRAICYIQVYVTNEDVIGREKGENGLSLRLKPFFIPVLRTVTARNMRTEFLAEGMAVERGGKDGLAIRQAVHFSTDETARGSGYQWGFQCRAGFGTPGPAWIEHSFPGVTFCDRVQRAAGESAMAILRNRPGGDGMCCPEELARCLHEYHKLKNFGKLQW